MPVGTTLLEATQRAGLPIASACDADGLCAGCALRVVEGAEALDAERPDETAAKRRNRVEDGLRLACRVLLRADTVVTAPYW